MGARSGFEDWAVQATPQLFSYARLLVGQWHAAEDLVQDALTAMYVNWHRVDQTQRPTAYAKQTLFRLYISKRRRKSSSEVLLDVLPDALGIYPDETARLDLGRALADLTPTERAVVVARYVDDLPVRDVAELFGRSEAWVRTKASRSLSRLRANPALTPSTPLVRTTP